MGGFERSCGKGEYDYNALYNTLKELFFLKHVFDYRSYT